MHTYNEKWQMWDQFSDADIFMEKIENIERDESTNGKEESAEKKKYFFESPIIYSAPVLTRVQN